MFSNCCWMLRDSLLPYLYNFDFKKKSCLHSHLFQCRRVCLSFCSLIPVGRCVQHSRQRSNISRTRNTTTNEHWRTSTHTTRNCGTTARQPVFNARQPNPPQVLIPSPRQPNHISPGPVTSSVYPPCQRRHLKTRLVEKALYVACDRSVQYNNMLGKAGQGCQRRGQGQNRERSFSGNRADYD